MKQAILQIQRQIQAAYWNSLREAIVGEGETIFSKLLSGPPRLKKILLLLRQQIASPHYQTMKKNEEDGLVRLLHKLTVASYAHTPQLAPYRFLGEKYFAAPLEMRPPVNDRTLKYLLRHPKIIWQAFVSTELGRSLTGQSYDPKLKAENYPGALFDLEGGIRFIYTPTPTYGLEIAPEAHALLQALENGQNGYLGWIYINLQDQTHGEEANRSRLLMQLNDLYPNTFFGMSLAQDAGIYRYEAKKALLDSRNFALDSPSGYFFPAKTKEAQELWLAGLESLIDKAEALSKRCSSVEDRKTLFCELLNVGIIHFFMKQVAKRPLLMSTTCKESIDRGAKISALMLWIHKGPKAMSDVLSCLQARALYVRSRQIRPQRHHQAMSLLKNVPHNEVIQFLN